MKFFITILLSIIYLDLFGQVLDSDTLKIRVTTFSKEKGKHSVIKSFYTPEDTTSYINLTPYDFRQAVAYIKSNQTTFNRKNKIIYKKKLKIVLDSIKKENLTVDIDQIHFYGHKMKREKIYRVGVETLYFHKTRPFTYYTIRKTASTISLYILSGYPYLW